MNVNPHLQYLQDPQGSSLLSMQQQRQLQRHMLGQNQNQTQNQNQAHPNQAVPVHSLADQNLQSQSLQNQNMLNHNLQNLQNLNQNLLTQAHNANLGQAQNLGQNQNLGNHSRNPLLSVLNGSQNGTINGSSFGQTVNPLLQMHMQQLQPQQQQLAQQQSQQQRAQQRFSNPALHQQLPAQALPHPMHLQLPTQKIPIIKEVWSYNVEPEFNALRSFVNDKTARVFLLIHQEIPGVVARPVGTFKTSADYHFQTLRSNLDLLNIIQMSFCAVKVVNNEVSNSVIWQFNFLYDVTKEMYNEEHLLMLALTSQINFALHMSQGISHFNFAELMVDSGLLLDPSVNWLSYHSGYDLGFFISLLTNDLLPNDEADFSWWCDKYFPSLYDLKHIGTLLLAEGTAGKVGADGSMSGTSNAGAEGGSGGIGTGLGSGTGNAASQGSNKPVQGSNKPSVEYLAEELHLLPISPMIRQYFTSSSAPFNSQSQHLQMTSTLHAYLLMECFKELLRQTNYDLSVFAKYKGCIWGLGKGFNDGEK